MSLDATVGRNGQALAARFGQELQVQELAKRVTIGDASALVAQTGTITVDSAQNSTVYSLSVSVPSLSVPITVSYTSDSSTSTTEIATGLTAALVANSITNGLLTATSATNVISYTAVRPNQVVTISSSAASAGDLTIATVTAAAAGGSYTFGREVNLSSFSTTSRLPAVTAATLPTKATFTLLAGYAASSTYALTAIIRNSHTGALSDVAVTWAAGASATAMGAAAEVALEAALSGAVTVPTVDGTDVSIVTTLAWPTEFVGFAVQPTATGGSGMTLALDGATALGVAPRGGTVMNYGVTPPLTFGVSPTATAVGAAVSVFEAGGQVVVADPGAAVTYGASVYVETTAGATNGRYYPSSSATRYIKPGARWVQRNLTLADGTTGAVIELE